MRPRPLPKWCQAFLLAVSFPIIQFPALRALSHEHADGYLVRDVGRVGLRDDPRQEQPSSAGLGVHGTDSDAGGGSGDRYDTWRRGRASFLAVPLHGGIRGEFFALVRQAAALCTVLFVCAVVLLEKKVRRWARRKG